MPLHSFPRVVPLTGTRRTDEATCTRNSTVVVRPATAAVPPGNPLVTTSTGARGVGNVSGRIEEHDGCCWAPSSIMASLWGAEISISVHATAVPARAESTKP